MRKSKTALIFTMFVCLLFAGILCTSDTVYAKKITSVQQAERLAKKKVKNASVTEVDKDYENGKIVYDVHLWKKSREYELTYRASDGKLMSYGWEEHKINRSGKKAVMSRSQCRKLALKKVKGASVTGLSLKYDDGVEIYKVKLKQGSKKYVLEYHARTRELIAYEWEVQTAKKSEKSGYIGWEKAKQIALAKVPGADVVKIEFDKDDGVPVYEVELIQDMFEYEIKIHAKTGRILEFEKDYID